MSETLSRNTVRLILAIALLRLAYLALSPFGLSGDEAYYWDWGRHLDFGYYSKPPFIGWLMGVAGQLGGDTAFGIRVFAVLFGTGTLFAVATLATRLYGRQAGFWTALAFALTPGNVLGNIVLTIDAPLLFFWTAALLAFWQVVHGGPRFRYRWWVALTLALGFGYLTKQMMLVFPVLALIYLALSRETRPLLAHRMTWMCLGISLLFLVPPLAWNAANDWITFQHTGSHFDTGQAGLGDLVARFGEFIGGQMLVAGPIGWILAIGVTVAFGARLFRRTHRERFLWIFCGPGIAAFFLLALRQDINPNWPAVFYPAVVILTVGWAFHGASAGLFMDRLRGWFKPGVAVGAALCAAFYVYPFLIGPLGLRGTKVDISSKVAGWEDAALRIHAARVTVPGWEDLFILTTGHRYQASQLAFYLPDQPATYRYERSDHINSQYELWGFPPSLRGSDALIIVAGADKDLHPKVATRFASVERLRTLPADERNPLAFTLYIGRNWQGPREGYPGM